MRAELQIKGTIAELQVTVRKLHANAIVRIRNLQGELARKFVHEEGVSTLFFCFPISGIIEIEAEGAELITTYQVKRKRKKLPTQARRFVDAAIYVANNLHELHGYRGEINGYKFAIYSDLLLAGLPNLENPARIVHETNEIELSFDLLRRLNVQERILILLHEFAHGWLNVVRENEEEADMNAIKLYALAFLPNSTELLDALPEKFMTQTRLHEAAQFITKL